MGVGARVVVLEGAGLVPHYILQQNRSLAQHHHGRVVLAKQ